VTAWRAVEHLKTLQDAREGAKGMPAPPELPQAGAAPVERAARDFAAIADHEKQQPDDVEGAIAKYRDFMTLRHPQSPEADAAAARIHELVEEAGRRALERLESAAPSRTQAGDYEGVLADLRAWDSRYATTAAAPRAEALRTKTRTEARAALDVVLQRAGALVATQPHKAHALLLGSRLKLPGDLASELAALLERADQRMRAAGLQRDRPGPVPPPREPTPPANGGGPAPRPPPRGETPPPRGSEPTPSAPSPPAVPAFE
jgi:hypothetical protein